MNKPSIIISRPDLERLERLIDNHERIDPYLEALQSELDRAEVVAPDAVPSDVVTMNSTVRCREDSSGKEHILTLTYPQQAGAMGKVSVLAPIGSALLGLSVGQRIDWQSPLGKILKLNVLSVERNNTL